MAAAQRLGIPSCSAKINSIDSIGSIGSLIITTGRRRAPDALNVGLDVFEISCIAWQDDKQEVACCATFDIATIGQPFNDWAN